MHAAQSLRTRLLLGVALSAGPLFAGCAPPVTYKTADHWSKEGYEWPPGSGDVSAGKTHHEGHVAVSRAKQEPTMGIDEPPESAFQIPTPGSAPRIAPPEPTNAPFEEGKSCLRALGRTGVSFQRIDSLKGVDNPVEIRGKLGGIIFYATDHRPLQMDCRLALALERLAPVFAAHGLTRVRYSGAYSYRRTRSGRLSHHAHGLAIDLHDLEFGAKSLSVEDDFARNVGCDPGNPPLNRLACSMRQQRLFEEFLTPDYNFDHRDHLHIAVPRRT